MFSICIFSETKSAELMMGADFYYDIRRNIHSVAPPIFAVYKQRCPSAWTRDVGALSRGRGIAQSIFTSGVARAHFYAVCCRSRT